MDYLLDYMPVVGDIVRTAKYSYKLGQIIGEYFSQREESESYFTVVWRRTDVFMKEEKESGNEIADNFFIIMLLPPLVGLGVGLFYQTISDGDIQMVVISLLGMVLAYPFLIPKVMIPYLRMRRIKKTSEIELTNNPYKLIRTKTGKMGICYWETYGNAKLLLKPKYDNIELGFNGSYVVKYKDKYMLYNVFLKMFVADKCDYIIKYEEDVYLFIKGDEVSLMTPMGDRVYE
jgi:hypothetical protein